MSLLIKNLSVFTEAKLHWNVRELCQPLEGRG